MILKMMMKNYLTMFDPGRVKQKGAVTGMTSFNEAIRTFERWGKKFGYNRVMLDVYFPEMEGYDDFEMADPWTRENIRFSIMSFPFEKGMELANPNAMDNRRSPGIPLQDARYFVVKAKAVVEDGRGQLSFRMPVPKIPDQNVIDALYNRPYHAGALDYIHSTDKDGKPEYKAFEIPADHNRYNKPIVVWQAMYEAKDKIAKLTDKVVIWDKLDQLEWSGRSVRPAKSNLQEVYTALPSIPRKSIQRSVQEWRRR